ncbi:MATE family efflux transporter [Caproiciproducens faecalis]|uniref:Probable multidrug resistance protein NorM n=1 Tax=Caproiciproducens faecalis TaxID=2820301 RepID=A0ABS7DNM6_9FIRM|nr:MATE family efflux transporter [Caproiciproducens faecalis]MBW7572691.1 MATE family efflux transporter [Caproiciproducens faecalis]
MEKCLTSGKITSAMLRFAVPMIIGDLLQQLYNIVDTLIVGQFVGKNALAAVGSSYTLMTFLTSILMGMCMGSGTVFSLNFGEKNAGRLKKSIYTSFLLIFACTVALNLAVFFLIDPIMHFLRIPAEIYNLTRSYLWIIFWGIGATFLYNFYASLLRSIGNSVTPLVFLGISAVLNVGLDLLFVLTFQWGVAGAAIATVISQIVSGAGIMIYTLIRYPEFRIHKNEEFSEPGLLKEISHFSFMTCIQQSIMNFGILMVQGLINSFGIIVMAAFAAAVKIDSFAYMPLQDFGNAFSIFIAQNYGANQFKRIKRGIQSAFIIIALFSVTISAVVCIFARPLMLIFIQPQETEVMSIGMQYLWIEGACYLGIGFLFLFYGLYRAIRKPGMSVVLTIISLGTRVILAYILSAIPEIGVIGIWLSVPTGWFLADAVGMLYYHKLKAKPILEVLAAPSDSAART